MPWCAFEAENSPVELGPMGTACVGYGHLVRALPRFYNHPVDCVGTQCGNNRCSVLDGDVGPHTVQFEFRYRPSTSNMCGIGNCSQDPKSGMGGLDHSGACNLEMRAHAAVTEILGTVHSGGRQLCCQVSALDDHRVSPVA